MPSRMTRNRSRRRVPGRAVVATAAALLLVVPLGASQAQSDPLPSQQGKKFAAYEYGWYPIKHVDHFDDPLPRYWHKSGPGIVQTQNGMITIISTKRGSTGATIRRHAWTRGRWEIRMRAKRFEAGDTNFRATAELIPAAGRDYNCGARNIALANFRPTGKRVRHYVRTRPNHQFSRSKRMKLTNDYWHTYGVEVTRKRITWFTDGKARSVERRPAALSGVPLALRLQLTAAPGKTMNHSRLQVDTVRFFTLKSKNKKPVRGPHLRRSRYGHAC